MNRISSRFASVSFLTMAISSLIVGVVWASTAALQSSTTDTTLVTSTVPSNDEDNDENDEERNNEDTAGGNPDSEIEDLRRRVTALSEQVEGLTEIVSTMKIKIDSVEDIADKATSTANKIKSVADSAAIDATAALELAKKSDERLTVVEVRTSKMDDAGDYTGTITPGQLSRKLTPTDLSGDWPLDRVTGDLEVKHILMQFSSNCSERYGFYSVLITDGFRRIQCARIAAP